MERNREISRMRRAPHALFAAAFGASLLAVGVAAAPARADGNFERGFEDQLGRILAYETVHLGKHVLFQGGAEPHYTHASYRSDDHRYAYESRRRRSRYHRYADRHHGHRRHWRRHQRRHHSHHDGHRSCGGRY